MFSRPTPIPKQKPRQTTACLAIDQSLSVRMEAGSARSHKRLLDPRMYRDDHPQVRARFLSPESLRLTVDQPIAFERDIAWGPNTSALLSRSPVPKVTQDSIPEYNVSLAYDTVSLSSLGKLDPFSPSSNRWRPIRARPFCTCALRNGRWKI